MNSPFEEDVTHAARHYARLSRKRVSVNSFILNERNQLLIVKPTYRSGWLVPGGSAEEDESPQAACEREIFEEIGLKLKAQRLLCIEYQSRLCYKGENIQFVFFAGMLTKEQEAAITLPPDELSEYRFVTVVEAFELLIPRSAARMRFAQRALADNSTIYIENGMMTSQESLHDSSIRVAQ